MKCVCVCFPTTHCHLAPTSSNRSFLLSDQVGFFRLAGKEHGPSWEDVMDKKTLQSCSIAIRRSAFRHVKLAAEAKGQGGCQRLERAPLSESASGKGGGFPRAI